MFEFIKGKLIEVDTQKAIIETNGIGYKIFIPSSIYNDLLNLENALLYTSFIVKEDSQTLYGFLTKVGRDIFDILISVSGIGAKTAILLLGNLDLEGLYFAITTSDIKIISKVPGIGKKTAERLIIELRDKFKNIDTSSFDHSKLNKSCSIASDAIAALMNLGYNSAQAQKAVKSVLQDFDEKPELGLLITKALKNI